ncbi:hypothetical protein CYLTODRAFT_479614 [Cylindrobasidium torrendii FP15055 ss-10]|uniref:Uncharacterized protein n=1 Tax=Cylindrobasidium torrendii FP15055 ss-10 TaxID=1314674 RepID=A0A0D7ASL1_9AGAR|nr:hypothetical protein CYLTODRAFT_479614 [Cylindrobasidium torrendii FP15055 ss-10]
MVFNDLRGSLQRIRRTVASTARRRSGRPDGNKAKEPGVADSSLQSASGTRRRSRAGSLHLEVLISPTFGVPRFIDYRSATHPLRPTQTKNGTLVQADQDLIYVDTSTEADVIESLVDNDGAASLGITFADFSTSLFLKLNINHTNAYYKGIYFAARGPAICMEDASRSLLNFLAVQCGGNVNDFPFTGLLYFNDMPAGNIYDDREDFVALGPHRDHATSGCWAGKQIVSVAVQIALASNTWVVAELSSGLLTLDLAVEITPGHIAQVGAHAIAIGCYLVRMKAFPPKLSPCCLLAALENPAALEDLSFAMAVAPELARPLLAWSNDLSNRGPFRNPSHPDYASVRRLVELYTDINPETLERLDRVTESKLRTSIFVGRLLRLPVPMEPVEYESHPVVQSFRRSLNPIINMRGQRLFDYKTTQFPAGHGYKSLVAAFTQPETPDLRHWLKFSTSGDPDLKIFEEEWMQHFVRWVSRKGPLSHVDLHEFYNDDYRRAIANQPGFRVRSVLATVTGSQDLPKDGVTFAFLGRADMFAVFQPATPPLPFQAPFCQPPIDSIKGGNNTYVADIPLNEDICYMLERTRIALSLDSDVVTEADLYLEVNFVLRGKQVW